MFPVLVQLGWFRLYSYGALAALGFLFVVFFALRRSAAYGWPRDRIVDLIFYPAMAGLLGSRAVFVFQTPEILATPSKWLYFWDGGLVFYGAPLVGLPLAVALLRRFGLPTTKVLDVFAAAFPIGHAISRIGCFGVGCCHGAETDVAWAVVYPPGPLSPPQVPTHPVQLYESAALLMLGAYLVWRERSKRFDGEVILSYLGGYSVIRMLTESFRGDARGWFAEAWLGETVSTSRGVSLIILVFVALAWWRLPRRAP